MTEAKENGKRAAKLKAVKETPPAPPPTLTFLVDGNVLQKTVEFLASFQLAHPASVQRDQLIGYYTSLKAIEHMGNDDSGKA